MKDATIISEANLNAVQPTGASLIHRFAMAGYIFPSRIVSQIRFILALLAGLTMVHALTAAPTVTNQGAVRRVIAGGQGTSLSVMATGNGPLGYQWLRQGRPIPGATSDTLALTNFTRADAGWYVVAVADSAGTCYSKPFFLVFEPGTGPSLMTQLRPWGAPVLGLHDIPAGLTDVVDISVLSYNLLALRAGGTVVTWGVNASYFATPVGLNGVVGIAVADDHRAAVKSDGTVVAWGDNSYKQCDVPVGLSDVVAVACGGGYTLALKSDGTVVGWGGKYTNQSPYTPVYAQNVPAGLKNVVAITALINGGLALCSDGTYVSWTGAPGSPELTLHEDVSDVVAITGAKRYGLLKRDGTVQVVPNNYYDSVPYVPAGLADVVALFGTEAMFALKADGAVVAWQLSSAVPLPDGIPGLIKITDMTSGGLVLRDASADAPPVLSSLSDQAIPEGQAATWTITATGAGPFSYQWRKNGSDIPGANSATLTLADITLATAGAYEVVVTNYKGTIASNAAVLTVVPLPVVATASPVRQTFLPGENVALAVSATGTGPLSYQWYFNGRSIPGATTASLALDNLSLADSGAYVVRVTDNNGMRASDPMFVIVAPAKTKVIGWGSTNYASTAVSSPDNDIVAISAGTWDHSLALKRNGTVLRFGATYAGEAAVVAGLTNVVAVDAGGSFSLALRSNGTVVAWGDNSYGETDVPAGLTGVIAISAGANHALALTSSGKVVAWGSNSYGNTNVPGGLVDVIAIAAGPSHSLAVKADGTVVAWGSSSSGATSVPTALTGVVNIAAGAGQSLAVRGDRTATGWGSLGWFEGTVPAGSAMDVVAVVAGFQHSYLLKRDGTVYGWGSNVGYMIDSPAGLSGVYALSGKFSFTLALVGQSAPAIFAEPKSITCLEQQPLVLSVGATGLGPISYQWRKNGVNIAGATSSKYTITSAVMGDAGSYTVVVTNSAGSATSDPAVLSVTTVNGNAVAYGSTNFPATGVGASVINFNYKVTNTGTKAWGSSHYLGLLRSDGTLVELASLDGTAIGASKTVIFSLPTPAAAGNYQYTVQPVENNVEWFGSPVTLSLKVTTPTASAQGNAMAYGAHTFPLSAPAGSVVNFTYTASNAGTKAWGANHFLALMQSDFTVVQLGNLNGTAVGGSKTVNFSLPVPASPGTYQFRVQGLENNAEWFGNPVTLTLTVTPKVVTAQGNAVAYTTHNFPLTASAGSVVNFNCSLNNLGTKAWGADHFLALMNSDYSVIQVSSLDPTAVGASKSVNLSLPVPATPGTYQYRIQPLENNAEWFGQPLTLTLVVTPVQVTAQGNALAYGTNNFPLSTSAGSVVNFTYNVSNLGTKTWGATHFLALLDSAFTLIQFADLNGIAAGGSTTASFSFPAPMTPGTYSYIVRPLENGVEWFGTQLSMTLIVTPAVVTARGNALAYGTTTFPASAAAGSTVSFTYNTTNIGTLAWGPNHYLALVDTNYSLIDFGDLDATPANGTKAASLSFTAPSTPGTYHYILRPLENGVEFFGTEAQLTLVVF